MANSTVYVISDDSTVIEQVKSQLGSTGVTVSGYSTREWRMGLEQAQFRSQLSSGTPALVVGGMSLVGGQTSAPDMSNVLPFPGNPNANDSKVQTMDEIESKAIESAIVQYRGNLTEAAKALGIGRATLYRKVKQYHIDPSVARRKRAA
jgi:transcriptional regulator with GAF, ATPase, and Fis domain